MDLLFSSNILRVQEKEYAYPERGFLLTREVNFQASQVDIIPA